MASYQSTRLKQIKYKHNTEVSLKMQTTNWNCSLSFYKKKKKKVKGSKPVTSVQGTFWRLMMGWDRWPSVVLQVINSSHSIINSPGNAFCFNSFCLNRTPVRGKKKNHTTRNKLL